MRINLFLPVLVFVSLSAALPSPSQNTRPPIGNGITPTGGLQTTIHDHLPHKSWGPAKPSQHPANWNQEWETLLEDQCQKAGLQLDGKLKVTSTRLQGVQFTVTGQLKLDEGKKTMDPSESGAMLEKLTAATTAAYDIAQKQD